MIEHSGTVGHYLWDFLVYTSLAIAIIYVAYWFSTARKSRTVELPPDVSGEGMSGLEVESLLSLEPNKNLYVIRTGDERFLVSTSGDSTSCLSRLEPASSLMTLPPVGESTGVEHEQEKPWYKVPRTTSAVQASGVRNTFPQGGGGFKRQFLTSLQWLISSRVSKK